MPEQSSHGLACDGVGIAKDDIAELEKMQRVEDITHELFKNAARIHKAMRSNKLLRDVFRKYKHACREILEKKKEALPHLIALCNHCDGMQNNPHQAKHDLKCIQHEIDDIHHEIKALEELQWSDDNDSSVDSDESDDDDEQQRHDDDTNHGDDDDEDDNASVDSLSSTESSSSSSSSSSSDSDSIMDMATFH